MNIQSIEALERAKTKALRAYNKRMSKYDWHEPKLELEIPLRLRKKTLEFVGSNVWLSLPTMQATSYGWWTMLKRINGKLVFNSYRYSTSTTRHQSKVRETLRNLGIKVDVEIEAPKGLQDLQSAVEFYERRIQALVVEIEKPRSQKAKNKERVKEIKRTQEKIKTVKALMRGGN